jgi:uncharacterized phage protein gp47/JayE
MANNLQNALTMTTSGVVIPDTSVIREAIINDLEETVFQQKIDHSQETVLGRMIEWMTLCFAQVCGITAWVSNQFNIKMASGNFLDAWADNFNMFRKLSSNSRVFCSLGGTAGTTIPQGSYVANTNGDLFTCDADIVLDASGNGSGFFTAVESGPISCAANTVNVIKSAISGWDTVNNSSIGTVGSETESDYSLRNRILNNAFVGTGYVGTVTNALMQLEGVTNVLVLSNPKTTADALNGITMPAHSIYVCVQGGDPDEIAKTIYQTKPIGAAYTNSGSNVVTRIVNDEYSGQGITVYYNTPVAKSVSVTLSVSNQSYSGTDIESDVDSAIEIFFQSKGIGKTAMAIELALAIQEQVGGIIVTNLYFDTNSQSVSCNNQQVFSLGSSTITVS